MGARAVTMRHAVASLALAMGLGACAPGEAARAPMIAGAPATAPAPTTSSAKAAPSAPGVTPAPSVARFDPSQPPSPLDDPRLSPARDAAARGARLEAARRVEAELARATDLDGAARARWLLLSAVLRRDGGDPAGALAAFERVAAASPGLAPAARVEIAALALPLGQHARALAALEAIDETDRTNPRFAALHAEALVRSGQAERGAAALEAWLDRTPRPRGWATLALRVAGSLTARPGEARALAAARIARRVLGAARGASAAEAQAIAKRALASLPRERRARAGGGLLASRIDAARARLRAHEPRAAVAALDRLVREPVAAEPSAESCELWRLRGEALGEVRRRAEAAEAFGVAIERCDLEPALPEVLFSAGRASAMAGRDPEAASRFARLEARFPEDRLADDARVERVRALIAAGDGAEARRLAEGALDAHPDGDVIGDAPFLVALAAMVDGRWAEAAPILEGVRGAARERSYLRAGRFDYYLGRAREAEGDRAAAVAAYEAVFASHPVGYYAALAHARLEELAPGSGARAIAAARARAAAAPPLPEPTVEDRAAPALARAAELAAVGDAEAAEAELDGLGLASRRASPGLRWAAARLLARADAIRAHAVLRGATETEPRGGLVELDVWTASAPVPPLRAAWELAFPRPFSEAIERAAAESGTPASLLYAIMREESAFAPRALSRAGARGLLQLMPGTAAKMARPLGLPHDDDALTRPDINARLGARFLAGLRRRFARAPLLAVPAYNAGPLAVERWCAERPQLDFDLWVETIPYRETRRYTKRVLSSLAAYEALGGAPGDAEVFRTPRRACPEPPPAVAARGSVMGAEASDAAAP
jgi:soluble lytic murein transglycosylase